MKKSKKLLWLIPAVIIIAAAFIILSNLTIIKTFIGGLKYVGKDTSALAEKSDAAITEKTKEITGTSIVKLTDEQKEAMLSGELSEQEAIDIMLGKIPGGKENNGSDGNGGFSGAPESPAENPPDPKKERVNELVASVYILRDTFSKRVDDLFSQAKAEYDSIPKEERTSARLRGLLSKYAKLAGNLETECDGKITDIADELSILLTETGSDTSIVNEIIYAYALEKDVKRAYYIDLYKDKITDFVS